MLYRNDGTGHFTLDGAFTFGLKNAHMDVQFEDGLSAPAFERPTALAVTEANYGGMAFSSGIMAVYDAADSSVKLVAREVLSRTVVSGDEA